MISFYFGQFIKRSAAIGFHEIIQNHLHGIGGFAHSGNNDKKIVINARNNADNIANAFC